MKSWKKPMIYNLNFEDTHYDSSIGHYCHNSKDNCPDFTNGQHITINHTTINWHDNHEPSNPGTNGHTCCCYGLSSNIS